MNDLISREITEEMVKEYCQKRCLVLITREFFEELWIRYERRIAMEQMTSREICKLLEIVVGETEPIADSAIDPVREENLKTLIDIGDWVLDGLLYTAEHRKDFYYSSQAIGERAYATMLEWKEWLAQKEEELA